MSARYIKVCSSTVFVGIILLLPQLAAFADSTEEEHLISILQSDQSLQEKDAACAKLKWIGTEHCVPALASLLTNGDLSHSARYALESLQGGAAEKALIEALAKTTGSNQVGIINSLGVRHDPQAVPDLSKWLADSNAEVAVAAASALGHIGGAGAVDALHLAWKLSNEGAAHNAQSDGLLACGYKYLTAGEHSKAAKIFQDVYDRETEDHIRMAAFRGLIMSSEKKGINLMAKAITGTDEVSQAAALEMAARVGGPATTEALGSMLSKLPIPQSIALMKCLQQRGDHGAATYIVEMLESTDLNVRMAAISALGDVGAGAVALRLAEDAATATGAEKEAARQALVDLRKGVVTEWLIKPLKGAAPEVQVELIRAMGARGDAAAAPKLLEVAHSPNDSIRAAAFQALALLAGPEQISDLVILVIGSPNEDARADAIDALNGAAQRLESKKVHVDWTPLAQATRSARPEVRVALIGVCGGIDDPQVVGALRAAMKDPDDGVRVAAIRAICDSRNAKLLPDMLEVATAPGNYKYTLLGIRGCVRLVTESPSGAIADSQKIDTLRPLIGAATMEEGKRLVLSGLASVPDPQTLALAGTMLDDAAVKVEASDAMIKIAGAIGGKNPEVARAALNRIIAQPANDALGKSARAALDKLGK